MSDAPQIVHMIITGITSVAAAVLAYLKLKDDKLNKQKQNDSVCQNDFQELKVKVAVLEERLENEIDLLNKVEGKIDHILEKL